MSGGVRALAAATGFSIATVSRVLNGSQLVSEETRRVILETARKLNYTPHPAAKALATRRTRIAGAAIPTIEDSIFARFVHAIEETLACSGYSLVLAITGSDGATETARAVDLLNMGAEALILSGLEHDPALLQTLDRRNVPLVCTSIFDAQAELCTIGYDNRDLGAAAARYLTELGHRRIGVVHGPLASNDRTRLRRDGIRSVLPAESVFLETALSVRGGSQAAANLLGRDDPPTAILCLSDVLALGVLFETSRRGLAIPGDVSVMGFDDLDWAAIANPPLTTIHLPVARMGRAAARAVVEYLEQAQPLTPVRLEGEIIERGSTAPLPTA